MPGICIPVCAPLRDRVDIPTEQGIRCATLPIDPSRLHFREMGFEEADLMLRIYARRVGVRVHNAEVVPDFS